MSEPNGISQRVLQIQKRDVWSNRARAAQMKLLEVPYPVRLGLLLMLLVLVLLLVGCGTTSTPSDFTPRNPSMPLPSQLQPSQAYSSSAAEAIKSWRSVLTDMLRTP